MSHIMKFTEWEQNGKWYCNDVSDLGHGSSFWWHPARMLNISLEDYILLLKDKFNAVNFKFPNQKILLWDWQSYSDCHRFMQFINKEAKKRKYFIC